MKLLWITHRKFSDFCATTPIALANGLIELGFDLSIINPERDGSHSDATWEHIGLDTNAIRGFQSRSFSKKVLSHLESIELNYDRYIMDWQVGSKVGEFLAQQNRPCFLMDRSPPADLGMLARMQWKDWKGAWKLVKKGLFSSGFVVSNAHLRFVIQSSNIPATNISVLEAGVVTSDNTIPLSREVGDSWKFVYHGRLDKHRGILEFMKHIVAWNDVGIACHLTLIGEGNAFSVIKKKLKKNPELFTLKGRMSQQSVLENLKKHHIGILPMPATKVWKLASPLKRGEYLASGLMIVGINHEGHRFDTDVGSWMQLHDSSILRTKISSFLNSISNEEFSEYSQSAIKYAHEHLSWSKSVELLANNIRGEVNG
ncbi:MAG: hypothetical protein CMA16_02720 [Euryarchaeota archaeon]|nr:hypothetical protein [Euryarchaeota archaeon]|tara:strand:- start:5970 stop:7082 length:1113 start_codon:yes stop_codon:yes gene_type:complete